MPTSLRNLKATVDTKTGHSDFSVTQNAAGTATLSYDDAGTFAYTPPDLTTLTLTDLGITDGLSGQFLSTDGVGNFTFATPADLVGIALTDLSVTTATASGNGSLAYDNSTGVFTFTPADTATALTDLGITDGTANQVLTTDGAGNFTFQDAQASSTINDPTLYENLNGSTSTFTIASGHTAKSILVYYNGVCLVPTTDYTVSGTTCTTTFTPQSGSDIVIRYLPI